MRNRLIEILGAVALPLCLAALALGAAGIFVEAMEPWMLPLLLAALTFMGIDVLIDLRTERALAHDEDETCEECKQ